LSVTGRAFVVVSFVFCVICGFGFFFVKVIQFASLVGESQPSAFEMFFSCFIVEEEL